MRSQTKVREGRLGNEKRLNHSVKNIFEENENTLKIINHLKDISDVVNLIKFKFYEYLDLALFPLTATNRNLIFQSW